jgi:DNA-binding NarL/FixJ family response regulator
MEQSERLSVLVADDHEKMRDCLVRVLQTEFDVIGAVGDGDELVNAAIELEPDVIVSDIHMPRLSGIEANKRLREQGVDVPFVFVSTDPSPMHRLEGALGAYVGKADLISHLNAKVQCVASERCNSI